MKRRGGGGLGVLALGFKVWSEGSGSVGWGFRVLGGGGGGA